MKSNVRQLVCSGFLLSVLVTTGCGRPGFEAPQGLSALKAASIKPTTGQKGSSRQDKAAPEEEDVLPPEAEQAQATQILPPPANVDPSIPDENEEPLSPQEKLAMPAAWDGQTDQADEWTKYTLRAIEQHGQGLLASDPSDAKFYCANWDALTPVQRKAFYVAFVSVMVQEESRFRPQVSYKESFVDSKGKKVVSRGLLQISRESANYYDCGFETESDLHDPQQNLSCGVRILDQWVTRDQRLAGHNGRRWVGGSRYWAVLRGKSDIRTFRLALSQLPYCQKQESARSSSKQAPEKAVDGAPAKNNKTPASAKPTKAKAPVATAREEKPVAEPAKPAPKKKVPTMMDLLQAGEHNR